MGAHAAAHGSAQGCGVEPTASRGPAGTLAFSGANEFEAQPRLLQQVIRRHSPQFQCLDDGRARTPHGRIPMDHLGESPGRPPAIAARQARPPEPDSLNTDTFQVLEEAGVSFPTTELWVNLGPEKCSA